MAKNTYTPNKTKINHRGQALRNRLQRMDAEGSFDHIVVSTSGGKDSGALLCWATRTFGADRIIALHAELDTDWDETLPTVKAQCENLGVKLHIVKREDEKGVLDLLLAGQVDRKTGEKKQKKWPGPNQQWCTAQVKTQPCDKFCSQLGGNVLVLCGERAEESTRRARKHVFNEKVYKRKGTMMIKASPIVDWTEGKVWAENNFYEMPKHPCYALGVSRASCAICIYSSKKEIAIAAQHNPKLVNRYLEAEKQINHKFRYDSSKKQSQSIQDILEEQGIELKNDQIA